MTDMSVIEALRVLRNACGIAKGDKIEVVKAPSASCDQYLPRYIGYWGERIGKTYRIRCMDSTPGRFSLEGSHRYNIPFDCLELVEKAKPEPPPIVVGGHEVAFLDDGIRVCDISVKKETLREILKRLEEKN